MDRLANDGHLPVAGLGEDEQQRIRDILARLNDEGWGDAEITIRGETTMSGHAIDNDDFEDACEASDIGLNVDAVTSLQEPQSFVEKNSFNQSEHHEPQVEKPASIDKDSSNNIDARIESIEDLRSNHSLPVESALPTGSSLPVDSAQPTVESSPLPATPDISDSFGQQIVPKPASKTNILPTEGSATVDKAAESDGGGGGGEEGTLLDRLLRKRAAAEPASARPEMPEVQVRSECMRT